MPPGKKPPNKKLVNQKPIYIDDSEESTDSEVPIQAKQNFSKLSLSRSYQSVQPSTSKANQSGAQKVNTCSDDFDDLDNSDKLAPKKKDFNKLSLSKNIRIAQPIAKSSSVRNKVDSAQPSTSKANQPGVQKANTCSDDPDDLANSDKLAPKNIRIAPPIAKSSSVRASTAKVHKQTSGPRPRARPNPKRANSFSVDPDEPAQPTKKVRKQVSTSNASKKGSTTADLLEEQIKKEKKYTTVKRSARTFIKNNKIYKAILDDTKVVSEFAREHSIYFADDTYRNFGEYAAKNPKDKSKGPPIKFDRARLAKYTADLKGGNRKNKDYKVMNEDYMYNVRGAKKPYDTKLRTRLIDDITTGTYLTALENNIWMHAEKRILKYLEHKYKLSKDQVFFLRYYLFEGSKNLKAKLNKFKEENQKKLKHYLDNIEKEFGKLLRDEQLSDNIFANIKTKPLEHLYRFYCIQVYNQENGLKNFILIPMFKPGRKHLNYSKSATIDLLNRVDLLGKKESGKTGNLINKTVEDYPENDEGYNDEWTSELKAYFNIEERKYLKFCSFSCNGADVSIRYLDTRPTTCPEPKTDPPPLKNTKYYVGIDPGIKLFVAGVSVDHDNLDKLKKKEHYTHIKVPSGKYRHDSKNSTYYFAKLNKRIDYGTNNKIGQRMPKTWKQFTKENIDSLDKVQTEYMKLCVTKKKFTNYINRDKTLNGYINTLFLKNPPKEEKKTTTCTVFYGGGNTGWSCIKGYVRPPNSKLIHKLKHHPKIQLRIINEYNTTKLCSNDGETELEMESKKKPKMKNKKKPEMKKHRYKFCPKCCTVWNRDINAGRNILLRGLYGTIAGKLSWTNIGLNGARQQQG